MSTEPKFCKDCKHYIPGQRWKLCRAPLALNKVTGEPGFADVNRSYDVPSACGPNAKWFEAAPPPPPPPPARWWEFWK